MDASHILVGVLTGISLGFLVWIEMRSRRNTAEAEQNPVARVPETVTPLKKGAGRQ
jgi:hypothetical protein